MAKRYEDVSDPRQIGERIRDARKKRGLSGFAVAQKADVGKYHYYVIERGEKRATIATLGRISKALGVSISYLLTGKNGGR